jgi:hypothetical protein
MLTALSFLNPWILAGLALLPVLWFLLRVTPPAPKRIAFPPIRFLANLHPKEQTSSHTPWWILLLRLLTAACVIIALAHPVLNKSDALPHDGAIRLVIDNGWAAAQTWDAQILAAQNIIDRSGRENRDIYIVTTAPDPAQKTPTLQGALSKAGALAALHGLKVRAWEENNAEVAKLIDDEKTPSAYSFWLTDGIAATQSGDLIRALQNRGGLCVLTLSPDKAPILLRPAAQQSTSLTAVVEAPNGLTAPLTVSVQATGADGRILDTQDATLDAKNQKVTVTFDLPPPIRAQVTRLSLSRRTGAGAVYILDDNAKRRSVSIAAPNGQDQDAPFLESSFYLSRALEPYADLKQGNIAELLSEKPQAMILPDTGNLPPDDLNALEQWVRGGGLLIRFAGENMTQADPFLTPVPLLMGGLARGGAMTWEKPQKLSPFPEFSPLFGLDLPADISVRRQMLAQPSDGLAHKTWAALEDGTPLITADRLDSGLIVLVHTTASPDWSDMPLSGFYVQMLRRIVALAGSSAGNATADQGAIMPLLVLDGNGVLTQPDSTVQPIPAAAFDTQQPDSSHPAGLYGRAGFSRAMNIGDRAAPLSALSDFPTGVEKIIYGASRETDLMPKFLTMAFLLFLVDWGVMIVLQTGLKLLPRPALPILFAILLSSILHSPTASANDIDLAGQLHLAYVRTGNASIDTVNRDGLEALRQVLSQRTSVDIGDTVAVDPETDDLSFFPLLYWSISYGQQPLSDKGLKAVQSYLDHGGTILFDTRDALSAPQGGTGSNAQILKTVVGALDIPPLVPMPEDHVLTRSFYLLKSLPGRSDGGTIWVEGKSAAGRDNVSSVIIGGNDWASGWASNGGSRRDELALRAGVNFVLYALTGNYKADQVHLPHILERIGHDAPQ